MNVEIKPITVDNYMSFFKEQPKYTIRGYSFFLDGEIVAVFGALLGQKQTMLFSDVKDNLQVSPVIIWRWAKRSLKLINDMKQPLYATSQKSGRFLQSLGFYHHGTTKYGELYEYLG